MMDDERTYPGISRESKNLEPLIGEISAWLLASADILCTLVRKNENAATAAAFQLGVAMREASEEDRAAMEEMYDISRKIATATMKLNTSAAVLSRALSALSRQLEQDAGLIDMHSLVFPEIAQARDELVAQISDRIRNELVQAKA